MSPADFADIPRDQYTTDELIAYAIQQGEEYATLHAPNAGATREALVRLVVIYSFERDLGERVHLRRGIDLLIGQYKWEQSHAA